MKTELVTTQDGSHTLFAPDLKEHFHSINGAVGESMHVFIGAGFNELSKKEIRILEVGLGTGLNAFLAFQQAKNREILVHYTALELYPLDLHKVEKLNYTDMLGFDEYFTFIHKCGWEREVKIHDQFYLTKHKVDLLEYYTDESFDLIFFDAFAPEVQPELWTLDVFIKLANVMSEGSILTTYSAKGEVRRAMESAGLNVERLQGPPGKREMLRAIKS
ncbi:MAG: SAM-dependent methyltransferase [Marinilabiliales bacterium]|nr:MAG: SAM-dependent methyltransferase [Marinilabiliales bacterium]